MATIGIIGSGNVGANTALFLAETNVADVIMYDIEDGLSTGKALDMMEAAPIRGYQKRISGTDKIDDILKSEIIIVSAGKIRKPGMKREELLEDNRELIASAASSLKGVQGVVIIMTEPVDFLTTEFARKSGLPIQRIMGLGGLLDSTRLRFLIARELDVSTEIVSATVIGQHSDAMIPLEKYCSVSGIPVTRLIDDKKLSTLFEQNKSAGDGIVALAGRTSAFYGPAAAVSDLAEAIIRDTRRIFSVSQMFTGQYGIRDVSMSLPAVIGKSGIIKVLEPQLDDDQESTLKKSAETIRTALGGDQTRRIS